MKVDFENVLIFKFVHNERTTTSCILYWIYLNITVFSSASRPSRINSVYAMNQNQLE